MERTERRPARMVGRYAVFDPIAVGGMAAVCFGRLLGQAGFARTVVIKRLHAQFAGDADFATMLLDEARIAARVQHPNVVSVIDVVAEDNEILLVMDYVHGESLAQLVRSDDARDAARVKILTSVVASALHGLHAAHEATGENGKPLGIVHRDVSPQNILVGADGVARVVDFGVAKAAGQAHCTGAGQVKGKVRYLSPEQILCGDVDRRTDVWGASVVLWEALTKKRLFSGDNDGAVLEQVLHKEIPSPRASEPKVPEKLARVILRGLARDPAHRWPTAQAMADALEVAVGLVAPREIGTWVTRLCRDRLESRRRLLDEIEADTLSNLRVPAGLREAVTLPAPAPAAAAQPPPPRREPRPTLTDETAAPPPAPPRPTLSMVPPVIASPRRRWRVRALALAALTAIVLFIGTSAVMRVMHRAPASPDAQASLELPPPAELEAEGPEPGAIDPGTTPPSASSAPAPAPQRAPGKARAKAGDAHAELHTPRW